jgi:Uma2 family endonuclease
MRADEAVTREPVPGQRMTFEEAARLDPDKYPGEIVDGKWVPLTKSTWRHGEIVGRAYLLLVLYAQRVPGWSVAVGDPGTKLETNPARLRGPDVGIIRAERRPTGKGVEGWLEGAPDVAVEVVGDGQSVGQLFKKALEYLGAGGKMVWMVDPDAHQVVLVTPPNAVRVLDAEDTLDGGDVLPGFSCKVAELFT